MKVKKYLFWETVSFNTRRYLNRETGCFVMTGTGERDKYNFNAETIEVQ